LNPVFAVFGRRVGICLLGFAAAMPTGCSGGPRAPATRVDIGVYTGRGAWDASVTAVQAAAGQFGYSVEGFDEGELFDGGLDRYLVVVIPGGDPREFSNNFGTIGRSRIKRFVEYGGGLVCLGGGAAAVDSDSGMYPGVGIFPGDARWPVDRIAPYPEYTLTDISRVDPRHLVSRDARDRYWTLYRWGPEFVSIDPNAVDVLYVYELTTTPAVVAFNYGAGRVFLSGCQMEIEEGDLRDGTDFADELEDPDSEWDLLERAFNFCLEPWD